MEFIGAFLLVMLFMFIGEWVSSASHAYIPSVFVTAALFLVGFWTIMPKDVGVRASYSPQFISIAVSILLVHLGTLMSLKELIQQWKAVCISLLGVAGTFVLCLTIGTMIFDWHTVIAAVPPLTGGMVSALLITNGLKAQGLTALVALPISMFVTHSVLGYPLISYMLRQEDTRLIKEFHANGDQLPEDLFESSMDADDSGQPGVLHLPAKFQTSAFIMARIAFVALLSTGLSIFLKTVCHFDLNANVICLIMGVIAHQLGFLENNALNKAGVFNWLMYGLLAYIFCQLSATTPSIFGHIIIQIVVLIVLGLSGMFLASWILAKPFGMSWQMAFACSLTALCGFPADYILTSEVANTVAKTEDEEKYVLHHTMPKMLVGGFATVSVASVVIADVFLKLL
ncbi:hypothetical protein HU830_05785 [Lactobacillus sp. DCY120]|uniref:Uncharacterized protein n=1 Tax=Bombilactobacillus apium TaxID=2675299 RepID=A0A850R3X3_9LACO|nr:hypothetical protein [Bombilactobacillus apium]NVY96671.1 hypothetical protein [Bombilactobacillus apium]